MVPELVAPLANVHIKWEKLFNILRYLVLLMLHAELHTTQARPREYKTFLMLN